jgi:transposase
MRCLGQFDALSRVTSASDNLRMQRFQSYKFRLNGTTDRDQQQALVNLGTAFGRHEEALARAHRAAGWKVKYGKNWIGDAVRLRDSQRNTSITCPSCGHVARENRRSQSEFVCEACRLRENADWVGAVNVLRAGRAWLACA